MKQTFIILSPKSDSAKQKLSHHGEKWKVLEVIPNIKFSRAEGPFLKIISLDGMKCIFVKEQEDPDFSYRKI